MSDGNSGKDGCFCGKVDRCKSTADLSSAVNALMERAKSASDASGALLLALQAFSLCVAGASSSGVANPGFATPDAVTPDAVTSGSPAGLKEVTVLDKGTIVVVKPGERQELSGLYVKSVKGSFVETALYDGSVLVVRNCRTATTPRYSVYAEGRLNRPGYPLVPDRVVGRVEIQGCEFGDSLYEAPLRFVEGTGVKLVHVSAGNGPEMKNKQSLRCHAHEALIDGCEFGWTIFGPQSDGKNPTNSRTKLIEVRNTKFRDGIRITRGVERIVFENCDIDLGSNWFNKHLGGMVEDVKTKVELRNCRITGDARRVAFPNSTVKVDGVVVRGSAGAEWKPLVI